MAKSAPKATPVAMHTSVKGKLSPAPRQAAQPKANKASTMARAQARACPILATTRNQQGKDSAAAMK